ncbi:MAG: HAMP domain-containing histidine kinase [Lachnospiraceae bacterium]|nr:HAMP domain-containing histidine kinase [Lachnospiraceae bacterium]
MKLKTRLIISFCIILFVPILLATLFIAGFFKTQIATIESAYGIEEIDMNYMVNSLQLMNKYASMQYEELAEVAENDPDKLTDDEYLETKNRDLSMKNCYLIVKVDGEVTYNGGDKENPDDLNLPDVENDEKHAAVGTYFDFDEGQVLIKHVGFTTSDGKDGCLFIVIEGFDFFPEAKELLLEIMISIVIILVCTAAMLIAWIYSGMIIPLKKLEEATNNIAEGNLDFTLEARSDDEIGRLCESFEEMRKRLKESSEEKLNNEMENRALISNIAHDLKTPITAVKGYSEGLLDGVADTPEKREKYLRTINNKANEIDTLLNELTLYSKIDTNKIPYNYTKLPVADYFNDCAEELGIDLENKNIGFSYLNYVGNDVLIIADPEQLKRVINNIVGNSVKYMSNRAGVINLRVKDVGDFIQVEIEDNGKGIAQKDLPYVFERFYRADASRNSATGGSGIGLSIVKKIIEDHGGKIWLTSKEDVGTIMYFVLRKYQEVSDESKDTDN